MVKQTARETVNDPVVGDGKTVLFVQETNFTANIRKSGITTIRSVQIEVENYSVSGETCVDLDIQTDTIVLGK